MLPGFPQPYPISQVDKSLWQAENLKTVNPLTYPVWLTYLLMDAIYHQREHAVVAVLYRTSVLPKAWEQMAEPNLEALAGWIESTNDQQAFSA